jgi:hypothetical protein
MKTTRLSRRLGLDGNPMRRRIDKLAACMAALLMAVFLIGAPMLSVAAARWAGTPRPPLSGPRAPGARCLPSCCGAAPLPAVGWAFGSSWVTARWTAPDGHERAGRILVSTGLAAGRTVRLWVDAAGSPTGPPPHYGAPVASEAMAAVLATVALGGVLWWLAAAGRWALDRRGLAAWEAAWAVVGPQWTWRFRSRDQL